MKKNGIYGLGVGLAVLAGFASSAVAGTVTVYSDRVAWEAAITGEQTIDFSTLDPIQNGSGGVITYTTPSGLTVLGVNFSDTGTSNFYVIDSGYCCAAYSRGADALVANTDGTGILVTLPANTYAAGMEVYSVEENDRGGSRSESVDFSGFGSSATVTTPGSPDSAFFGFVSSTPVSSFTIDTVQDTNPTNGAIMNFSFGGALAPAAATPEPAYGWLLAAGAFVVVRRGRSVRSS